MAWSKESRQSRGYGSAWTKLREVIIKRDFGLCQACKREGRLNPYRKGQGFAVDHIRPKAKGGADHPENLQLLCKACHDQKTEDDGRRGQRISLEGWPVGEKRHGYSIPDGVRTSGIPVVLLSGPPAAGKSHYIKQHAKAGDVVIDFDECRKRVGGRKWDTRKEITRRAFALRDQLIHELHNHSTGTAYLIVTSPSEAERNAWKRVLGNVTVVILKTPAAECIRRIKADPERAEAADRQIEAVLAWWAVN